MKLEAKAFQHKGEIPAKYTCEGEDVPPGLQWSGVPTGAQSLALIIDDPEKEFVTFTAKVTDNLGRTTVAKRTFGISDVLGGRFLTPDLIP